MTYDDLICELRNSKGWPNLGNAAADCIKQLVNQRDEAEDRALRYKSERDGQARKISDAQRLDTASFEAEQKIVNQREEIKTLQARASAAEADLAKAVGVLKGLMAAFNSVGNFTANHVRICTVAVKASIFLSELEKTE